MSLFTKASAPNVGFSQDLRHKPDFLLRDPGHFDIRLHLVLRKHRPKIRKCFRSLHFREVPGLPFRDNKSAMMFLALQIIRTQIATNKYYSSTTPIN